MPRVLLTWVGHTDLRASDGVANAGLGPIAQALKERPFDDIVMLCDIPKEKAEQFKKWVTSTTGATPTLRLAPLKSPTDYAAIHEHVLEAIAWVRKTHGADTELTFHLSPGTPQMATVWILVGTRERAKLIQSSKEEGVRDAELPFQIAAEFIPSITQQADTDLERLAGGLRPDDPSFDHLLHQSAAMKAVVVRARRSAVVSVPVLIEVSPERGKSCWPRPFTRPAAARGISSP